MSGVLALGHPQWTLPQFPKAQQYEGQTHFAYSSILTLAPCPVKSEVSLGKAKKKSLNMDLQLSHQDCK